MALSRPQRPGSQDSGRLALREAVDVTLSCGANTNRPPPRQLTPLVGAWRIHATRGGIHWMEPRDLHFSQMPKTINAAKGQCISSPHKGMASVAFADGRVRLLHDSISAETVESLLTVRGGETIPGDR